MADDYAARAAEATRERVIREALDQWWRERDLDMALARPA